MEGGGSVLTAPLNGEQELSLNRASPKVMRVTAPGLC